MLRRKPPSTTSLPPSPQDDETSRFRKYMLTMGIRVACLILMVVVYPYGWYTVVFAIGAIVLPYIAVVIANVGKDAHETIAERPDRAISAARTAAPPPAHTVIRVAENHQLPRTAPHVEDAP
ncbi:MAG: DUF3099 domain-containing protein [Microbacterium sp.]|uniref:DUF3099 domain-containing protein n=1 Tax=Microbacterium sp. TaxID=51671 RepID=UPI003A8564A2